MTDITIIYTQTHSPLSNCKAHWEGSTAYWGDWSKKGGPSAVEADEPTTLLTTEERIALRMIYDSPNWERVEKVKAELMKDPNATTRQVTANLRRYSHTMVSEDMRALRAITPPPPSN